MSNPNNSRQFFHALSAWARAEPRGCRMGGGRGGLIGTIQFHWRPDPRGPESHLTLEATSIDGHPGIRITTSEPMRRTDGSARHAVAVLGRRTEESSDEGPLGRAPDAVCEGCGAVGTVGRAGRTDPSGGTTEIHRFCRDCWPEQSARYRARWEEQDRLQFERVMRGVDPPVTGAGPGTFFEAATWHSVLTLVRELERSLRAPMISSPNDLQEFAEEIRRAAPRLDGDMPFEVEAFIHRYGASNGS